MTKETNNLDTLAERVQKLEIAGGLNVQALELHNTVLEGLAKGLRRLSKGVYILGFTIVVIAIFKAI